MSPTHIGIYITTWVLKTLAQASLGLNINPRDVQSMVRAAWPAQSTAIPTIFAGITSPTHAGNPKQDYFLARRSGKTLLFSGYTQENKCGPQLIIWTAHILRWRAREDMAQLMWSPPSTLEQECILYQTLLCGQPLSIRESRHLTGTRQIRTRSCCTLSPCRNWVVEIDNRVIRGIWATIWTPIRLNPTTQGA